MTPVHCRVRHNPPEAYGDCLRACIASVLDMEPEQVPHFMDGNPDAGAMMAQLIQWLGERGLAPFTVMLPGEPLDAILEHMGSLNPASTYLLFGGTGDGDHVVVCQGGRIVWNPAWYGGHLVQPASGDIWQVMVLGRV